MLTALPDRSASLQPFFTPRGVAVIGASRDPSKLSYGVMRNLLDPEHGYPGPVYPVNPRAADILGLPCYPDISAVPDPVELAVLLVPAAMVPGAVEACGRRGLKAAVVISGGFREIGPEGAAREREMVEIARRYGMRVMGPNGIGVIDTHTPLNTTFVKGMPRRGHIAFLSQSGALCGGIIDWALARGLGFSRFLSVGNEADVNETDVIPFLAADDISRVIALYLEDVKGGPDFVAALREAAQRKPVLAIKTGRTAGGQAATASHTGALAGVHAAFRAACKQTGVIEVESIRELFDGALALAYQPLPAGGRIAILTNAGGPAALAADALESAGLQLAGTGPEAQVALRRCLHAEAQVAGPVDMLGGADHGDYRRALDAVLADPANDGVLAILVPQVLVDPVAVVDAIAAGLAAASRGICRGRRLKRAPQARSGLPDGRGQPGCGFCRRPSCANPSLSFPRGRRGGVRHPATPGHGNRQSNREGKERVDRPNGRPAARSGQHGYRPTPAERSRGGRPYIPGCCREPNRAGRFRPGHAPGPSGHFVC